MHGVGVKWSKILWLIVKLNNSRYCNQLIITDAVR